MKKTDETVLSRFETLLGQVTSACESLYQGRLVSLAVYGSVGRGIPRPDSEIDLLIVADDLPTGRMKRMDEFRAVEDRLDSFLSSIREHDMHIELSPVIKTPEEVKRGSPLFLDMTEDARILYDREDFLEKELSGLRIKLQRLGSKRIWRGSAWYWDLKPDYVPGEVFEL
jgi:predicted nucleotidyltransferase